MMYWKLSLRNARRSFTTYLLYIVTMTILLGVMELSNCIAVVGNFADFQTISLPLLIVVIQIVLVEYIDTYIFRQRAKEFANNLLLGMQKKTLTGLFLVEILLIGCFCFLVGTTVSYGLFCIGTSLRGAYSYGLLYCQSVFDTFCCFCVIEIVCGVRLKIRMDKLQIRELMQEKGRSQQLNPNDTSKSWGIVFLCSFGGLIACVCGIVYLPQAYVIYPVAIVIIPLTISIIAFYQWIFQWLSAYRRKSAVSIYQKNRLYLTAAATYNFRTAAMVNAVFCMCFLFSACSFITGSFMLKPDLQLMEKTAQYWMGTAQLGICIVFTVIYFSILALQQVIEFHQNARHYQLLGWIGKSNRQLKMLVIQQIAIRLTLPMILALLIGLFCIPLLNYKMNKLFPPSMHNALLHDAGVFFISILFFFIGYFYVVFTMSKVYIPKKKTH